MALHPWSGPLGSHSSRRRVAAIHPRLQKPMRLINHAFFVAEHDDHHLAKVTELLKAGRSG